MTFIRSSAKGSSGLAEVAGYQSPERGIAYGRPLRIAFVDIVGYQALTLPDLMHAKKDAWEMSNSR